MLIINYLRFEVVLGLLWVPNEFLCPGLKLQFVRLTMITSSERNHYQWLQVLSGYILAVSTPYQLNSNSSNSSVSVLSMSVWWGSINQLWWQSFLWKSQLLCRPSVVWTFGKGVTFYLTLHLTWKLRRFILRIQCWWVSCAGESLSASVTWIFWYVQYVIIQIMNNLSYSGCNVSCCPWVEHGFLSRGKYVGVSPYTRTFESM